MTYSWLSCTDDNCICCVSLVMHHLHINHIRFTREVFGRSYVLYVVPKYLCNLVFSTFYKYLSMKIYCSLCYAYASICWRKQQRVSGKPWDSLHCAWCMVRSRLCWINELFRTSNRHTFSVRMNNQACGGGGYPYIGLRCRRKTFISFRHFV